MDYIIELAAEDDIPLIEKFMFLTNTAYVDQADGQLLERITSYCKHVAKKHLADFRMVVIDNQKVGMILLTDFKGGKLISEIYVDEPYRGNGIGTSLIKSAVDCNDVVYLWVDKGNERAIKLYKSLGFETFKDKDSRLLLRAKGEDK